MCGAGAGVGAVACAGAGSAGGCWWWRLLRGDGGGAAGIAVGVIIVVVVDCIHSHYIMSQKPLLIVGPDSTRKMGWLGARRRGTHTGLHALGFGLLVL